jgi:hypothetical protein
LLRKVENVELVVAVGRDCPFCPRVAAIALRFACGFPGIAVRVVRVDSAEAPPGVASVPAVLAGDRVVGSGSIGEYRLATAVLSIQG